MFLERKTTPPTAQRFSQIGAVATMALQAETIRQWEHFAHNSGVGITGRGPSCAAAFEEAAVALTAVTASPNLVRPRQLVDITCRASDRARLLVDWLNAIIFEMASRKMVFRRFSVRLDDYGLSGQAWGEPVDTNRHKPAVDLKGATYTALQVAERGNGWIAECVIDA